MSRFFILISIRFFSVDETNRILLEIYKKDLSFFLQFNHFLKSSLSLENFNYFLNSQNAFFSKLSPSFSFNPTLTYYHFIFIFIFEIPVIIFNFLFFFYNNLTFEIEINRF